VAGSGDVDVDADAGGAGCGPIFGSIFRPAAGDPGAVYLSLGRRVAARARAGTPFVVGVAGGVASGKTRTAELLATLLREGPGVPSVLVVAADGFLHSNAELASRGLAARKGFPESFDTDALVAALAALRSGHPVEIPGYSHLSYDVVPGRVVEVPDVVVIEGINFLQVYPTGAMVLPSDLIDLAIYLHAAEDDMRVWFASRLRELFTEARQEPSSFYHQWSGWSDEELAAFADTVWESINVVNLRQHIAPSRWRADVIIEQDRDHRVRRVWERRGRR
jgi:type I pantothenate kinase